MGIAIVAPAAKALACGQQVYQQQEKRKAARHQRQRAPA
jgi:hypothetical protein